MPLIRVKAGPNKGQVFSLDKDTLSIGRDPKAGIQIFDKAASRLHAEVFRIG